LNITPQQAAIELLRRQKMRGSLLGFAESIEIPGDPVSRDPDESVFLPVVGQTVPLHHRLLYTALQECMLTPYGRLLALLPPGAGKSITCSSVGPAWYQGLFPGSRIILASYATELAKKHSRKARQICRQSVYRGAFGAWLSKETSAAEMWSLAYTDERPNSEFMAGGLLSGITGNRANGVILDDAISGREAAESPTQRAKINEAIRDDLKTRMLPKAWMVMVGTRWHEEDPIGSLLPLDWKGESGRIRCRDGMVWNVVCLPAEAEHADDPLGRAPGEMLWPEYYDAQHWNQFRPNPDVPGSGRTWSSLFQQRPKTDETYTFQREWFDHGRYPRGSPTTRTYPASLVRWITSDFAVTKDGGDYTVHLVWGVDYLGDLWLLDGWRGQVETDEAIGFQIQLARRWNLHMGIDEKGVIQKSIAPAQRRMMREQKWFIAFESLSPVASKQVKVMSFAALAKQGKVHIMDDSFGDTVIAELCAFTGLKGGRDDIVDCCGSAGRGVDELGWARKEPTPEVRDESPPKITFKALGWDRAPEKARKVRSV
jgi:predicted phage terminase large subunit-like protein